MTSALDDQFRTAFVAAMAAVAFASPVAAEMPVDSPALSEFPVEAAAIVSATSNLFDTIEAEGGANSRQPLISGPVIATPASLPANVAKADVLTVQGPVDHLTGYRINWYPVDRFLGAVDFMGTWDGNRNLVCGYVTWDLSDPSAPVLEDVSAAFINVADLAQKSDEAVHGALLEANCAYGSIDANYAFFE